MSLSFVSSAVLTSTDGVSHNEETPIESTQVLQQRQRQQQAAAKPLFEQLRSHQEEEEAARQEFQKSIMRGTCALDEEDVAHLDALTKQRQEREWKYQQQVQEELYEFRAAKAAASAASSEVYDQDDDDDDNNNVKVGVVTNEANDETIGSNDNKNNMENNVSTTTTTTTTTTCFPRIIVKNKRRRQQQVECGDGLKKTKPKQPKLLEEEEKTTTIDQVEPTTHQDGWMKINTTSNDTLTQVAAATPSLTENTLASLLGGYSSSSSNCDE